MSTLSIRTQQVPHGSSFPAFARIISFVGTLLDVLADAEQQARAARCHCAIARE
jgi:hypothetical protein